MSALWETPRYNKQQSLLPRGLERSVRKQTQEQVALQRKYLQSYGTYFTTLSQVGAENINGQGLARPFTSVPFSVLRAVAALCQVDVIIIAALKAAARRFARISYVPGKQLGFRVVHKRHGDPHFDSDTPDIVRRCAEMERLIENPTYPVHASLEDWLINAINEQLVIDRRCLVLPHDRAGRVASFHLADGATIRPRIEVLADWMTEMGQNDPESAMYAKQAQLWRDPPISTLTGLPQYVDLANAAYVQVIEGRVTDAWTAEQMVVGIANPTVAIDHWGYGISPVEATLPLSLLFMKAFRFNSNLFDVTKPESALILSGDYDQEGVEGFRRAALDFDEADALTKMPVISGEADLKASMVSFRDTPRDMLMSEMITLLIHLKCAAYGVDSSIVNIDKSSGGSGPQLNIGSSEDAALKAAKQDGFHSLMMSQANLLTLGVVKPHYDDLVVVVEGLDIENPELQLKQDQFDITWKTENEFRKGKGEKPLPKDLPKEIGDFVLGGQGYIQAYNILVQAQAQDQQQDMGAYGQGDFGQGQGGQPGQPGQPGQDGQQDDTQAVQQGWQQGADSNADANPGNPQNQGGQPGQAPQAPQAPPNPGKGQGQ